MSKNACAKIASGSDDRTHETWTADRDYGSPEVDMITTRHGTGSRTRLRLRGFGPVGCKVDLQLTGREARTLYRVLAKHYGTDEEMKRLLRTADVLSDRASASLNEADSYRTALCAEKRRSTGATAAAGMLGLELLKTVTIEMPLPASEAFSAGQRSMEAPAEKACRTAYRAGMAKGFAAAQQLELFNDLNKR